MKLTMKHRYFLAGIFVIILGAIVVTAMITGTRHVQGDVLVTINTHKMTLQEAINNKYLNTGGPSPTASITTSVSAGHDASTIWVSVNGVENTLQYFLTNSISLCVSPPTTTSYTNPKPNPGHYASEIEVGGKNLQDAIDSGDFCATCSDGIQNQGETGVDCGGPCSACCTSTCSSLGYTCGTHTICGVSTNCGGCPDPSYTYGANYCTGVRCGTPESWGCNCGSIVKGNLMRAYSYTSYSCSSGSCVPSVIPGTETVENCIYGCETAGSDRCNYLSNVCNCECD